MFIDLENGNDKCNLIYYYQYVGPDIRDSWIEGTLPSGPRCPLYPKCTVLLNIYSGNPWSSEFVYKRTILLFTVYIHRVFTDKHIITTRGQS